MAKLYFCGSANKVEYYNTATAGWTDISPATARPITCIHGTADDNIWVGTSEPGVTTILEVWYYNGAAWAQHNLDIGANFGSINAIWVVSSTEVYVVFTGTNRSGLWQWDGVAWNALWDWWNAQLPMYNVESISPNEVYIAGSRSQGPPYTLPALGKWDGVAMNWEAYTLPERCDDLYGMTVVDTNTIYMVPVGTTHGRKVYVGKFGGPWAVDYDFSGEGVVSGFEYSGAYGGRMCSERSTGCVFGVTCLSGGFQPFTCRIKSGGNWSSEAIPDFGHGENQLYRVSQANNGAIRTVPSNGAVEDTFIYSSGAWADYDRLPGAGFWGSWIDADTTDPTIDTNSPDGVTTDLWARVKFSTKDTGGSGVVEATINCTIHGVNVIVNGVFQAGYRGPDSAITANADDGYDVVVHKESTWTTMHGLAVSASCEDLDGNSASLDWEFAVEYAVPGGETEEGMEGVFDEIEDYPLDASFVTDIFDVRHSDLVGLHVFTEGPATAAGTLYIAMSNVESHEPVRRTVPLVTFAAGALLDTFVSASLACGFFRIEYERDAGVAGDTMTISFKLKRKESLRRIRKAARKQVVEQRWWLTGGGRWAWGRGGSRRSS